MKKAKTVNWPIFGYDRARTRYLPVKGVKPPFRKLWRFTDRPLLEFPPIYVGGRLYFVNNSGFALRARRRHRQGALETADRPSQRLLARLPSQPPLHRQPRPGHIVKLDAKTGKTIWKRALPGRAESSPIVIDRTVYFGCEDGNLYALSTVNGNVRWATPLGGEVKSAPAYYGGKLFVGDYGGYMNAVDAKSGKLVWQSGSLGPGFGASGAFYSTPAVAFGRVYAGNNDCRVYSFETGGGELAWSYSTGGYAYSGPTVANTRHSPPTVFIGSFDGNVYAIGAKDGEPALEPLGRRPGDRLALGGRGHRLRRRVHEQNDLRLHDEKRPPRLPLPEGTYTPVISDGRRIYLTGYSSITALEPFKPKPKVAKQKKAKKGKRKDANGGRARPRRAGAGVAEARRARRPGNAPSAGGP